MPIFAALFGIVVMSSVGLPALAGFVGEFLILLGAFGANAWVAVVATGGGVLAAAYMLWMYRRVVFGALDKPENRGLIDLDLRERAVALALVVPILWIGVYPDPLLRRIEPSVSVLLQDMELRRLRAAATAARAVDSVSRLDGLRGRGKREKPGAEALTDRWERVGRTPG